MANDSYIKRKRHLISLLAVELDKLGPTWMAGFKGHKSTERCAKRVFVELQSELRRRSRSSLWRNNPECAENLKEFNERRTKRP